MDKDFNLEDVGKRMPYTVPDNFFDQLESNVMAEVKAPRKANVVKVAFRTLLAAAAAVTLFLVISRNHPENAASEDLLAYVEQAYSDLDVEDQEFLMEIYEEDDFINPSINTEQ